MTRASPYRRRPRYVSGIEMPRDLDGRTLPVRRFKGLVEAYTSELGGQSTEADRALISQAAAIRVQIERRHADILQGRDVDEDLLIRLTGEERRLLTALRSRAAKAKPAAGPSIDELFAVDADEAAE
jgi:hypothetical protein